MSVEINRSTAPNRMVKLKIWILVITFFAYMIAFFDRSNVTVLIADISFTNAFGITAEKSTQGLLLTAFLLFYGITCFFAGPAVNRFGARRALGFGLLSWAALMAVMGSISSVAILLACRALLGIGEAVLGPSVSKLVQSWFPVRERAKANGAWYIGLLTAQITAIPLITWWVTSVGWRGSFYILALIGAIPAIAFFFLVYDSPSQHPGISREEIKNISGGEKEDLNAPAKSSGGFGFIRASNFWIIVIIYSIINAGCWGFLGWVPTYFKATLGFSFAKMGLMAALPFLVGAAAVLILTPMMDKFNSRAPFTVIGCLGFGVTLFAAMNVSNSTVAVAIFCLANAFILPVFPSLFTILQNITKPTEVANATGFFNGTSYIFASAFPYAMGALYTSTGNLKNGFYLLVSIMVIAVIAGIPLIKRRL